MTTTARAARVTVPLARALTSNRRVHYRTRYALEQELQDRGRELAAQLEPLEAAALVVRVWWPDRRRRDVHNLMPTVKPLVDGMVLAGWLPDDNDAHLLGPFLVAELEPTRDRGNVVLELEVHPGLEGVLVARRGGALELEGVAA